MNRLLTQGAQRLAAALALAACVVAMVSTSAQAAIDPVNPTPVDGYDGRQPSYPALSPDGAVIYVANFGSASVSVIDPATGEQTGVVQGLSVDAPYDIAFSPDGSLAYATGRTIAVIDVATNTQIGTVSGVSTYLSRVAFSPNGARAYVMDGNQLRIVDTTSHAAIGTVAGFSGFLFNDIAVTPDGSTLFLANYGSSTVDIVDLASGTRAGSVTGYSGISPSNIEIGADGAIAWVTNEETDTVSVIDIATRSEMGTVAVGSRPAGIASSPSGTYLYVTNIRGGDITIVSTSRRVAVGTLPNYVGERPIGITVTASGDAAYVSERLGNRVVRVPIPSLTPIATGLSPARGPAAGGSVITISGNNFQGVVEVTFGDAPGTDLTVSPDGLSLTVTAPEGARGASAVTLAHPDGLADAGVFTYFTRPDPPSQVSGSATSSGATLTWSAPPTDGGDPITTYRILQRLAGTSEWSPATADVSGLVATVTGLDLNIEYEFGVVAVNAAGDSEASVVPLRFTGGESPPGPGEDDAPPPAEAGSLAASGADSSRLLTLGVLALSVGVALLAGRRRDPTTHTDRYAHRSPGATARCLLCNEKGAAT